MSTSAHKDTMAAISQFCKNPDCNWQQAFFDLAARSDPDVICSVLGYERGQQAMQEREWIESAKEDKVGAVKSIRAVTKLGLKEAKELIEALSLGRSVDHMYPAHFKWP